MTDTSANRIADNVIRQSDVVAFDWDGTLIDSVPYKIAQNQAIAEQFSQKLSLDEVRTIWNESSGFADLMQNLCQTKDMDAIMEAVRKDYNNPAFAKRPFEFTPSVLNKVKALGKQAVLITNLSKELLEADAKTVNIPSLEDYFDFIQTPDDYPHKMPNPRVFDNMLKTLDIEPSQTVYIGDEVKDAVATKRAGMRFIGVESGMATSAEFASVSAFSIKSLGELALKSR